jgi:hypothetical membrane protein
MAHESTAPSLEAAVPTVEAVTRSNRLAGALFFLLAAQFMVVITAGAAMVPGYDFGGGAISDLGVAAESALLFNGSLVVVGLATIAGGAVFHRTHRATWLLGLYALAGIGAIVTGLFPLDSPTGLHGIGAILAFVGFNLVAIGTGLRLRGPMRLLSVALGLLGLVFLVVMAVGDGGNTAVFGPLGHGGVERMIVYPPMLWLLAFGGYLLGADGPMAGGLDENAGVTEN